MFWWQPVNWGYLYHLINYDLLYCYDLVFEIAHYIATFFCIEIVNLKGYAEGKKKAVL